MQTCHFHPGAATVAICGQCGRFLCQECQARALGICFECASAIHAVKQDKRRQNAIIDIVIGVVIAVGVVTLLLEANKMTGTEEDIFLVRFAAFGHYLAGGTVLGWRAINRWTHREDKVVVSWSIIGGILKLLGSYFVGAITAPFLVIGAIFRLVGSRKSGGA